MQFEELHVKSSATEQFECHCEVTDVRGTKQQIPLEGSKSNLYGTDDLFYLLLLARV